MLEKIKKIKWFLINVLIIIFGYIIIFNIQNYLLKNELNQYWIKDQNNDFKLLKYESMRCNQNIFTPQFAFVTESITLNKYKNLEIYFYNPNRIFSQDDQEWEKSHIGATDISNITFKNLLLMVKNDCYQFQKTFYQNDDNKLYWTWSKSIKETPEQVENRKKKKEEIKRQIKSGEIKKDTRTLEEVLKDIREREAKEEQENKN